MEAYQLHCSIRELVRVNVSSCGLRYFIAVHCVQLFSMVTTLTLADSISQYFHEYSIRTMTKNCLFTVFMSPA